MDQPACRPSRVKALHDSVWQAISSRPDKSGKYSITEPEFVPAVEGYSDDRIGKDFPVLEHLDEAIEIARQHELAEIAGAFARAAADLAWSQNPSYTRQNSGATLLDGYAYASLSGPRGPLECMSPRGGFLLMGPRVHYPAHNHAPREVYLIMTPGIEWQLDEGEWFATEPGDLIYHEPWQMHAMRSTCAPVLAFAAWLEPGDRREIGWSDTARGA